MDPMNRNVPAFYGAVARADVGAVRAALASDAALAGARDRLGSTPLHLAAFRGATELVVTLLDAGAEASALERESRATPLHWAAQAGHDDVVRLLLARGAPLEVRDAWYGLTPLGWATAVFWGPKRRRDGVVALLREAGAQTDAFVELGLDDVAALQRVIAANPAELGRRLGWVGDEMQPLHWAGAYGREEAISLLLEAGADADARTTFGLTPLGTALQRAQSGSAAAFLRAGISGDESTAVVGGFVDALEADAKKRLTRGLASRFLFVAASEGHEAMVRALVRRGADPATRLTRLVRELPVPATPLHLSVLNGSEATVKALIEVGGPVNAGVEAGTPTPLHVAAAEGVEALVRLLLDAGADRAARETGYDGTPSDWAAWGGHGELATRLRAAS
jgi:ankyrin repeat protein